jgi:hypothetical protein
MLRNFLVPLFPVFALVLTAVQTADDAELPQEMIDCRAMPSATERLDCYDQLVDAHTVSTSRPAAAAPAEKASPDAAAPPVAAANTEPAVSVSQEALFGKNAEQIRQSVQESTGTDEIDQIAARISKIRKSGTGYVVITLDNGQVWQQSDSSRLRLSDNDEVTIRRAAFGSFMLRKAGGKTTMRVKRIS